MKGDGEGRGRREIVKGDRRCTAYLQTQGEGAFVIRDSDTNPGWHMIGVKHDNKVLHDKIRMSDRGQYELLPGAGGLSRGKM